MLRSPTRSALVFLIAGVAIMLSRMAPAAESAAGAAASGSSAAIAIHQEGTSMLVACGGQTLMEYRLTPSPAKPYVVRLYTPGGVNVLRDQVPDHKHHHGLMFAIAADGVNFWEETPGTGSEVPQGGSHVNTTAANGTARASLGQDLAWIGPKSSSPILLEDRTIVVGRTKDGSATLLTWCSTLSAPPGRESVTLTGHHYFGLGMRFPASMDKGGRFSSAPTRKRERAFAAMSGSGRRDGRPTRPRPRASRSPWRFSRARPILAFPRRSSPCKRPSPTSRRRSIFRRSPYC